MPRLRNFSWKTGLKPVGPEASDDRSIRRDGLDLELEDVLELDHVRLHTKHLDHLGHAPRAVLEPLDVDEQVESRRDVLPDGPEGEVEPGHHHHRLDAVKPVSR